MIIITFDHEILEQVFPIISGTKIDSSTITYKIKETISNEQIEALKALGVKIIQSI